MKGAPHQHTPTWISDVGERTTWRVLTMEGYGMCCRMPHTPDLSPCLTRLISSNDTQKFARIVHTVCIPLAIIPPSAVSARHHRLSEALPSFLAESPAWPRPPSEHERHPTGAPPPLTCTHAPLRPSNRPHPHPPPDKPSPHNPTNLPTSTHHLPLLPHPTPSLSSSPSFATPVVTILLTPLAGATSCHQLSPARHPRPMSSGQVHCNLLTYCHTAIRAYYHTCICAYCKLADLQTCRLVTVLARL